MPANLKKYFQINDILFIGALFLALGLGWNTVIAMQKNYRLQQKYDYLKAQVELQELQNQNLKYQIAYLKTDDYLELAAREKFNKAFEGEVLVYLPNNAVANQAPTAKTAPVQTEDAPKVTGWRGNIQAWWHFLQHGE